MPRPKRVPAYSLHKPSGQARVILAGKHVYLGPHGSPQSREKYARLIAEHFTASANGDGVAGSDPYSDLSVNELLVRYLEFAESYYARDGEPTGEVENLKDAMRALRAHYGTTRARDFGPRALKAVRQSMIDVQDLSRGVINARVDRLKRIFRWAVSEELLPPSVYEGLRTVAGLRRGRSTARETQPVRPVPDEWVSATLPFLSPQVADMVRLQRLTGIRSGNLVMMRPGDLDRSKQVWIYEPSSHKTLHHGRRLQIPIGPQAQTILRTYLNRDAESYIFCPQEAAEWHRRQRQGQSKDRKTPVYPSELRRLEKQQQARGRRARRRPPGDHYDADSYRRAIQRGIRKANTAKVEVPMWFPHQLRHARATEVRKQYGLEGAQLALGHAKANITEVYAERDLERARRIARKTG